MKTKDREELIEIKNEILEKIYAEAKPPIESLEEARRREESVYEQHPVYELHYMSDDEQLEILQKVLEEKDLNHYEEKRVMGAVLMGAAPNGNKEKVNQYREEEGLETI